MKTIRSFFLFFVALLAVAQVFGQSAAVKYDPVTNRLQQTALKLPSGATLTVESGGALDASAGGLTMPKGVYLFSTFVNGEDKLRIAYSTDGVNWADMSDNAVFDPGGSDHVRDPHLWIRNGIYYVAYTAGSFGAASYWKIAKSTDLLNWSSYATVSMSAVSGANQVWFGCFYVDPATGIEHVFNAVSANLSMGSYTSSAIYEQHPSTPGDYSAWSTPVAVTGTSLPTKIIAEAVQKVGSDYRFFIKNDSTGSSYCMSSTSLLSGYTLGSALSWGTSYEGVGGPVSLGGNSWRAWLDKFSGLGMYYSDSTDNFATWSAPVAVVSSRPFSNTGVVFSTDAKVIVDLLSATASNHLSKDSSPRFAGLNINVAANSDLPVHIAPPFGLSGGTNLDSPAGVQNNVNLMKGGTLYNAFVIDGNNDLKVLSWPLVAYISRWSNTDGTFRQLVGNITIETAGNGLQIKEGSNARMGTATLSSGTITVSNTSVTASTRIMVSRASKGSSTAIGSLSVGTVTASTSFVVNALKSDGTTETGDVSVVTWLLIEPVP